MFKIAYLDDEEAVIRQFQISTMNKLDIPDIELTDDIDGIILMLKEERYDALIMDYSLNDTKDGINFTGIDVINKVFEELEDFPCFILTSFEETAEEGNINPDMIYSKSDVLGDSARFVRKIERKIINYQEKIQSYQRDVAILVQISSERPLKLEEEERLIHMDNFLERISSKSGAIPEELKSTKNDQLLKSLIEKTEMILEELENDE